MAAALVAGRRLSQLSRSYNLSNAPPGAIQTVGVTKCLEVIVTGGPCDATLMARLSTPRSCGCSPKRARRSRREAVRRSHAHWSHPPSPAAYRRLTSSGLSASLVHVKLLGRPIAVPATDDAALLEKELGGSSVQGRVSFVTGGCDLNDASRGHASRGLRRSHTDAAGKQTAQWAGHSSRTHAGEVIAPAARPPSCR
jgi:hypothetical protein